MGGSYLHDLGWQGHHTVIGCVAYQFAGAKRHKILKLEYALGEKMRVFRMQGRAALAAVMNLTHDVL